MGELIFFFHPVRGFLALDPMQFQWEWAGEQGDPDKDPSWWGITEPSQKTLGEVQTGKKHRTERFVVATFTVQCFYP